MRKTALINKSTLRFIREKTNVSFDYIYKKTKFPKEKIIKWEEPNNNELPTFNQAKILANCFQIPFAGLYMKAEDIRIKRFPKLKNKRIVFGTNTIDESAINLAVLDLLNFRDFILDNTKKESLSRFSPITLDDDFIIWANWIRKSFMIDEAIQLKCKSTRQFYLYVRNQIEQKGILVQGFKSVDVETLRGVSIFFDIMPIIGINENDRYPAKIFSMIHELVHLLKNDPSYCNAFFSSFAFEQEEVFCNAVAGEFLVPKKILIEKCSGLLQIDDGFVKTLAKTFSVSREVIIRRLFDTGFINEPNYRMRALKYSKEIEQEKEAKKRNGSNQFKPNIIIKTFDRVSPSFLSAFHRGYAEGKYDKQDFARYLNINQIHVDKIINEVSKWSS